MKVCRNKGSVLLTESFFDKNYINFVKNKSGAIIKFLALLIIFQVMIFKLTQKNRHYKLSAMPTIKEVKEFAYSYDEGELQANYEQAFLIVFNLNQFLPIVYVILYILAIVSSIDVTSGFVVTTVIYLYINLANIRFVNKYFRK